MTLAWSISSYFAGSVGSRLPPGFAHDHPVTLVPGRGGLSQPDPGKAQLQPGYQVQLWLWGLLQLPDRTPATAGGESFTGPSASCPWVGAFSLEKRSPGEGAAPAGALALLHFRMLSVM